jgi:hypothetical protein
MPRAFKANPDHPAVAFLVQLHADIGGRVKENRREAKRLANAMRHVEAVIRLFDPAYNMGAIAARCRKKGNRWYKRGTMSRTVLEVLKVAPAPLSPKEITVALLRKLGHAEPGARDVKQLENCVRSVLRQSLKHQIVADNGRPAKWRLN